jgi:hypothetical protein
MKNFLFFINHVENSISKTLVYYVIIIFFTLSGFMIGRTSNIINNIESVKIANVDDSDYNTQDNNYGVTEGEAKNLTTLADKSIIFGSVKGKYFYYKGCGGDSISKKNLRYYKSESEAVAKGKKLYSKCQ